MRASQLQDPLYEPEPFDFDAAEPMRPIRLQYVTLSAEKQLLVDTCERLGLVHVWVGQSLYALNECDSNAVRLTAREQLTRDGLAESFITEAAVTRRAEALVVRCVIEQGQTVERSALRTSIAATVGASRRSSARSPMRSSRRAAST
jgi:hypothetical protein